MFPAFRCLSLALAGGLGASRARGVGRPAVCVCPWPPVGAGLFWRRVCCCGCARGLFHVCESVRGGPTTVTWLALPLLSLGLRKAGLGEPLG